MNRRTILAYIGGAASAAVVFILIGAGGKVTSPTGTAPERYVYYPGTEALIPDEIRITACGTGLPAARRGQAASCFLLELGGRRSPAGGATGSSPRCWSAPLRPVRWVFLAQCHS